MDITQDDLRFLHLFRAAWAGGASWASAEVGLAAQPGRAAGRVAAWSLCRAAEALRRGARRRLVIGETLAPSADERRLILAARELSAAGEASETLRWLVRVDHARPLADRLAGAACATYGYAAPRRAKAASA